MFDSNPWIIYRLTSGYGGIKPVPPHIHDQHKAITAFCWLRTLFPSQAVVMYSYPFAAL